MTTLQTMAQDSLYTGYECVYSFCQEYLCVNICIYIYMYIFSSKLEGKYSAAHMFLKNQPWNVIQIQLDVVKCSHLLNIPQGYWHTLPLNNYLLA